MQRSKVLLGLGVSGIVAVVSIWHASAAAPVDPRAAELALVRAELASLRSQLQRRMPALALASTSSTVAAPQVAEPLPSRDDAEAIPVRIAAESAEREVLAEDLARIEQLRDEVAAQARDATWAPGMESSARARVAELAGSLLPELSLVHADCRHTLCELEFGHRADVPVNVLASLVAVQGIGQARLTRTAEGRTVAFFARAGHPLPASDHAADEGAN